MALLIDGPVHALYAHRCNHLECHEQIITLSDNRGVDTIWDEVMKKVYEGKIKSGKIPKDLYEWIGKQLFEGVVKGFGGDFSKYDSGPDLEMLKHLHDNVHVFSAFKTYQQLREATMLLTDADGKIRPFADFKKDMIALNEKYNVTWLNAEYNQAVASSQMASVWVDIEKNKDSVPYLRYETAGDDRVRDSHAVLEGIIKPVGDAFWDTYYPPNDWGCRCDVTPLVEGEVTKTSKSSLPKIPVMFQTNTAKSGVVFPEKHPYYSVPKEDKEAAKKLFGVKIPKAK